VAFAKHGATLILSDRTGTPLDAIAATCRKLGAHTVIVEADLGDPAQVERLGLSAIKELGRVDILVCNAGMQGPAGSLLDIDRADWNAVFQVNLSSAHALAAKLIPGMAERGRGRVILLASIAAVRGNKAIGLYGLTKAALTQMARNLAVEWGPRGVTVNAIAPGLIRTPLAQSLISDELFMARRLAMTPLRRVGEPHEVASVAVLLASAGGAFITGQTLVVDGGTVISDGG
jgi:NAD(P)-dependent dehydrogenase (short-subunit alcohol dehydrogenase family)